MDATKVQRYKQFTLLQPGLQDAPNAPDEVHIDMQDATNQKPIMDVREQIQVLHRRHMGSFQPDDVRLRMLDESISDQTCMETIRRCECISAVKCSRMQKAVKKHCMSLQSIMFYVNVLRTYCNP